MTKTDHGNNARLFTALVPALISRARDGIAKNDWERRNHYEIMLGRLLPLEIALEDVGLPEQIGVGLMPTLHGEVGGAKILLGSAATPLTVVDNWVGPATLDCLRDVQQPIRLLTGQHPAAISDGFDRAFRDFQAEGFNIEVRRCAKLHDRYVTFNDRCWLVGSSLKDAGKKGLNILEFVDLKGPLLADIEGKWREATIYVP